MVLGGKRNGGLLVKQQSWEGMLHAAAAKRSLTSSFQNLQRVISRLESVSPQPPRLSHDEGFCEQLKRAFCRTTGMLGQAGSELLPLVLVLVFKVGFSTKYISVDKSSSHLTCV